MVFVGLVSESVDVPIRLRAAFIGKGGEHIQGLQKQSGCRIEVCLSLNNEQ